MSARSVDWFAVLAPVLILLAVATGSYWAGDHNRNNAWLAKQATVERDAHAKNEAEVVRGDTAVSNLITESQAMQGNFQKLTEKFNGLSKRVPLAVFADAGADSFCRNADVNRGVPAEGPIDRDGADSGVLTAGAVWMWNSALAGQDQPAGACSLADTSTAACAAETNITLDDAWANHRANAQACAADRLAHDRLIDFLTKREGIAP